jgi:hypothetical protein
MKRKFTPTEEQKQAAAERRDAFKKVCAIVAALPVEKRVLLADNFGIRTPEGRELSPFNQCLLVHQNSSCSIVGGFAQWRANGRKVRKGSRALGIWVPKSKGSKDGAGETLAITNGETPTAGDIESKSAFFMGYVFDISQTVPLDYVETEDAPLALPAPLLCLPEHADSQTRTLALA